MNKPLVSVIIPAYNPGKLILETLASILNQSYSNIEIIVVDDGSKDDTKKILEPLVRSNQITYHHQENQGQAAARKNGFAISHGDFVSFIDADDLISPEKIEVQVSYLIDHPDCGVCYSDILHFWHHEPENLLRKKLHYYSGFIFDKIVRENFIQVMTAVIRRDVLEKHGLPGPRFRRSDDWYLWLKLSLGGVKFCFIDKVMSFQRRQKEGSLSDQKTYFKETAETNLSIYEDLVKNLSKEDVEKYDLKNLINFWHFRRAVGALILEDKKVAYEALISFQSLSLSDRIKKIILQIILALFPAKMSSYLILSFREFLKRRSFSPVLDPALKLPSRSVSAKN